MSARRPPRRLPLMAKQVSDFYKGNRVGSMGHFVRRGGKDHSGFRVDNAKVRSFVAPVGWVPAGEPGASGSVLTPFVPKNYKPNKDDPVALRTPDYGPYKASGGPASGKLYLDRWKEQNGRT